MQVLCAVGSHFRSNVVGYLVAAAAVVVGGLVVADAGAFWNLPHTAATSRGLSDSERGGRFIPFGVYDDIEDEHKNVDSGVGGGLDERHFDDCEFNGGAEWIRDRYADARRSLRRYRPLDAADAFGKALHPAQDFYSHSNWVELGFPLNDVAGTSAIEVGLADLVDLSGAQSSLARRWGAPGFRGHLRGDILLGADDGGHIPANWSIRARGGRGEHVPKLIDPQRRLVGRLLVSGMSRGDTECRVLTNTPNGPAIRYLGASHKKLNKDGPSPASLHRPARAMATLQTSYEWCRLVREAGLVGRDGLLLATWVGARANPHPGGTPCAEEARGPNQVRFTIESIRVRDSKDSRRDDPGEIQFGVALYDDPSDFRTSAHGGERRGVLALGDGELVPEARLPAPLSICVANGKPATLALHGWDNDQDTQRDVNMKTLFDDSGDDDDLLVGFQRRFPSAAALPAGAQVARSDDLEIRYRIDSGGPRLGCLLSPPLPPPDGPPVPPAGKPDLVISELPATENRFTVKNQGSAAAGKFSVTATGFASFQFSGLSAGESESRTYATDGCQPTTHEIRADSLSEVNESDETNNVASLDVIC